MKGYKKTHYMFEDV